MSSAERYRARVERGRADPTLIPHGESGYANWGCRCLTCCLAGSTKWSANAARWNERRRRMRAMRRAK